MKPYKKVTDFQRFEESPFKANVLTDADLNGTTIIGNMSSELIKPDDLKDSQTVIKQRKVDEDTLRSIRVDAIGDHFKLTPKAKALLTYLIKQKRYKDEIKLNWEGIQKELELSRSNIYPALAELLECGAVARSNVDNLLFINTVIFSNKCKFVVITYYEC